MHEYLFAYVVLCRESSISCCKSTEVKVIDPSKSQEFSMDIMHIDQVNGSDLPMYSFKAIAAATNNFSDENKLGQGGFGPVYKVNISSALH